MLEKGDASREEYDKVLVGIYLKEALGNEERLGPLHLLMHEVNFYLISSFIQSLQDEATYDFDLLNKQSSERLSEKDALISGQSRMNLSEFDNKPVSY